MFTRETVARWTALRDGRGHEVLTLLANTLDDLHALNIPPAGLPSKQSANGQFDGYVDYCTAVYVQKLRELFAVVADCIEKERYLGMVNCLRSIVEHAGVLHEFLSKPAARAYSESHRAGAVNLAAYDSAMADFDKFIRGNMFPWDELGSTAFEDLGPRAVEGSPRAVKVGKVALPALYAEFTWVKALYNMLCDMVHPNAGGHMLMFQTSGGHAVLGGNGDRHIALEFSARPLVLTLALYEKVIAGDLRRLVGLRLSPARNEPQGGPH